MKTLRLILVLLLGISYVCPAQTGKPVSGKVDGYYFHYKTRCATCLAVEAETKKSLELLYGDKLKRGEISFRSVNLEEPAGKELGDRLKIDGQTLLLMNGTKKVNITNEGFLYALTNPDKLKSIIKEKVDGLLKP